jgi:hypothetical protein
MRNKKDANKVWKIYGIVLTIRSHIEASPEHGVQAKHFPLPLSFFKFVQYLLEVHEYLVSF